MNLIENDTYNLPGNLIENDTYNLIKLSSLLNVENRQP